MTTNVEALIQSQGPSSQDILKIMIGNEVYNDENQMSHSFWINDLLFAVPPEAIVIQSEDNISQWQSLRTNATAKIPTGAGTEIFSISLTVPNKSSIINVDNRNLEGNPEYSTGENASTVGNNTGRRGGILDLIIQFKNTPFARVENAFIRSKLGMSASKNIAVCLHQLAIATSSEPGCVSVNLTLTAFNYSPYSIDWYYKYDWATKERFGNLRFDDVNPIDLEGRIPYRLRDTVVTSSPESSGILREVLSEVERIERLEEREMTATRMDNGETAVDLNLNLSMNGEDCWNVDGFFMQQAISVAEPSQSKVFKDYIDWLHAEHRKVKVDEYGNTYDCTKLAPYNQSGQDLGEAVVFEWKEYRKFSIDRDLENRLKREIRNELSAINRVDPYSPDFAENVPSGGLSLNVGSPMEGFRVAEGATPDFGDIRSVNIDSTDPNERERSRQIAEIAFSNGRYSYSDPANFDSSGNVEYFRFHEGIDLFGPASEGNPVGIYSPILSVTNGTVVRVQDPARPLYIGTETVRRNGVEYQPSHPVDIDLYESPEVLGFEETSGSGYGAHIYVKTQDPSFPGGELIFVYAHLAWPVAVKEGDTVFAGQEIARMGCTGVGSFSPHLHFEVSRPARPGANYISASNDSGTYSLKDRIDPGPLLGITRSSTELTMINQWYTSINPEWSYERFNLIGADTTRRDVGFSEENIIPDVAEVANLFEEVIDRVDPYQEWVGRIEATGWKQYRKDLTVLDTFYKEHRLIVPADSSRLPQTSAPIICDFISLSCSNLFRQIPMLGGIIPTAQYLGKRDDSVMLSLKSIGLNHIKVVSNMIRMLREQAIKFRHIPECWGMKVYNNLINATGHINFVAVALDDSTIESAPGLYGMELRLISNPVGAFQQRITYVGSYSQQLIKQTFLRELFKNSVRNIMYLTDDGYGGWEWVPNTTIYGLDIGPSEPDEYYAPAPSDGAREHIDVARNNRIYTFINRMSIVTNSINRLFMQASSLYNDNDIAQGLDSVARARIADGNGRYDGRENLLTMDMPKHISDILFFRNGRTAVPYPFNSRRLDDSEMFVRNNNHARVYNSFFADSSARYSDVQRWDLSYTIANRENIEVAGSSAVYSDADLTLAFESRLEDALASGRRYIDPYFRLHPKAAAFYRTFLYLQTYRSRLRRPYGRIYVYNNYGGVQEPFSFGEIPLLRHTISEVSRIPIDRRIEVDKLIYSGYGLTIDSNGNEVFGGLDHVGPGLYYGPVNIFPINSDEIQSHRWAGSMSTRSAVNGDIEEVLLRHTTGGYSQVIDWEAIVPDVFSQNIESFETYIWDQIAAPMFYNLLNLDIIRDFSTLSSPTGSSLFPETRRLLERDRMDSIGDAYPDLKLPLHPYWNQDEMSVSVFTDPDFYMFNHGVDSDIERPSVASDEMSPRRAYSLMTETEGELAMLSLQRYDSRSPYWCGETFTSAGLGLRTMYEGESAAINFEYPVNSTYAPGRISSTAEGGMDPEAYALESQDQDSDSDVPTNRLVSSGIVNDPEAPDPYLVTETSSNSSELENVIVQGNVRAQQGYDLDWTSLLVGLGPNMSLPRLPSNLEGRAAYMEARALGSNSRDTEGHREALLRLHGTRYTELNNLNVRGLYQDFDIDAPDSSGNVGYDELNQFTNYRTAIFTKVREALKTIGRKKLCVRRAFPTFKIFLIEEDAQEKEWIQYDDMYTYNQIESISVSDSRKRAASTCEIVFYNLGGALDGANMWNEASTPPQSSRNPERTLDTIQGANYEYEADNLAGTAQEQRINGFILEQGVKIKLKLGYSNNSDRLQEVFLGEVIEVEYLSSGNQVKVIAQSYGTELVARPKGSTANSVKKTYMNTFDLLGHMMFEPEVLHFGRKKFDSVYMIGEDQSLERNQLIHKTTIGRTPFKNWFNSQARLVADGFGLYSRIRDYASKSISQIRVHPLTGPQDDNLYIPSYTRAQRMVWYKFFRTGRYRIESDSTEIPVIVDGESREQRATYAYFQRIRPVELEYNIFFSSIWDIFQEMTLRHTGFVKHPRIYKNSNRMTMFFGMPDQMYWSEDSTIGDVLRANTLFDTMLNSQDTQIRVMQDWLRLVRQRFKPFRQWHHVNSVTDIVANNIVANKHGFYTAVSVQYNGRMFPRRAIRRALSRVDDDMGDAELVSQGLLDPNSFVNFRDRHVEEVLAHRDLSSENIRQQFFSFPNCKSRDMAKKYAHSILAQSAKEMYKGSLIVLGNSHIKPYDVVIVADAYNDIYGPIEVEEVIHTFSPSTGFLTEIIPDTFVIAEDVTPFVIENAIRQTVMIKTEAYLENAVYAPEPGLPSNHMLNQLTSTFREEAIRNTEEAYNLNTLIRSLSGNIALAGGGVWASALAAGAAGASATAALPLAIGGAGIVGLGAYMYQRGQHIIANYVADQKAYFMIPLYKKGRPWVAGFNMTATNSFYRSTYDLMTRWINNGTEGIAIMENDALTSNRRIREINGEELTLFARAILEGRTIEPGMRRWLTNVGNETLRALGVDDVR